MHLGVFINSRIFMFLVFIRVRTRVCKMGRRDSLLWSREINNRVIVIVLRPMGNNVNYVINGVPTSPQFRDIQGQMLNINSNISNISQASFIRDNCAELDNSTISAIQASNHKCSNNLVPPSMFNNMKFISDRYWNAMHRTAMHRPTVFKAKIILGPKNTIMIWRGIRVLICRGSSLRKYPCIAI